MALGPRLDLRQSQSLVMTPQLQQAIKLLALSNLEIEGFLAEEIERNPLLEAGAADDGDGADREPGIGSGDGHRTSIGRPGVRGRNVRGPQPRPGYGGHAGTSAADGCRRRTVDSTNGSEGSAAMILLRRQLGEVLRRHRLRQGLTLRELSTRARVSLGYLSEIERGQKEASSELLASLCDALEVPLSDVLREVSDTVAVEEARLIAEAAALQVPVRGNVVASAA